MKSAALAATIEASRRPLSAPLKREGGAFIVLINQAIVLDFVVDSGAGDVIIPQDVFSTLIRTGTIQGFSFDGHKDLQACKRISGGFADIQDLLLTLAGTVIDDVSGSVTAVEGSLLLGQSFLHPFQIVANR